MITNLNNYNQDGRARRDYLGLSTDVKPTDGIAANSLFMELNTGDIYYYTGEAWEKVGG